MRGNGFLSLKGKRRHRGAWGRSLGDWLRGGGDGKALTLAYVQDCRVHEVLDDVVHLLGGLLQREDVRCVQEVVFELREIFLSKLNESGQITIRHCETFRRRLDGNSDRRLFVVFQSLLKVLQAVSELG